MMSKRIQRTTVSVVALLIASVPARAGTLDEVLGSLDSQMLGEVDFAVSCNDGGKAAFEVGLLLLHHMMYRQSDRAFQASAKADPNCAMAQWGIAMTKFHPLWPGGPSPDEAAAGRAAAQRLASMDAGSPREAAYVDAVLAFYASEDVSFRERLAAWAAKQREIDEAYPEDLDAAAFDALAQLTLAPRGADAVPVLRDAGQRMDMLRQAAPRHPAGYHYALHAYDHPALATSGLKVARGYEAIAPEVPHALHMPSHIFTRLGLWKESAEWNTRSAAAVLAQTGGDIISDHYPHAIDYAVYAHLQSGDVAEARALLAELEQHSNLENIFGSAYATAAAAARVPLETDDWAGAAALPTDLNPAISWKRFPQAMAIRRFAQGIGAARSGDTQTAELALKQLAELGQEMEGMGAQYWLTLLDAQTTAIRAWIALSHGDTRMAAGLMRQAADIEDKVGKAPVTPGHVLPARELLGDLLLTIGDSDGARKAYTQTLAISPNRRRSLRGLEQASGG